MQGAERSRGELIGNWSLGFGVSAHSIKYQAQEIYRLAIQTLALGISLVVGCSDLEFPANARWLAIHPKHLTNTLFVRVILHGQCSLQRKEAI